MLTRETDMPWWGLDLTILQWHDLKEQTLDLTVERKRRDGN